MPVRKRYVPITLIGSLAVTASLLVTGAAVAAASPSGPAATFTVTQILSGTRLSHTFIPSGGTTPKTDPLTQPDDITMLGGDLFAAFQNGVGAQGEPSTDGNTFSTVVEFTPGGVPVQQWDIVGKCDGLVAQPSAQQLIVTVNEDLNSSVYTIAPGAAPSAQVQHFTYNETLPHNGGTDAISIYHGMVFMSASAPGTTGNPPPQATYPAVYSVTFDSSTHVATVKPVFYDEDLATVVNSGSGGKQVHLALTDPDSNSVVPSSSPKFGGDFMLTSQGDLQQIFVQHAGAANQKLMLLNLSQSVDDTAWVTSSAGTLYTTDGTADTIDAVTGPFQVGTVLNAVTPCNANNAPPTCPSPPKFPPNYLGMENLSTGHISKVAVSGPAMEPKGVLFVP